ncbi:hypothetical protein I4U23_012131 [Adineta vaga]|nr:hypothetical protein I4U23_012131 [Adineta vaga]
MKYLILLLFICPFIYGDFENIKEMGFKFWLEPGVQECYHELVEKGSRIYFMYEILNADTNDDHIIVFFRNAHNGSIINLSRTPQRGHLDLLINETTLIDICMDHETTDNYAKYMSVFLHIYHVDKILEKMKEIEHFDNVSTNVRNAIESITHRIMISREYQMEVEMLNQKDFYLLEETFFWINRWALIHIFIIVSCFSFQTYFIKRLFKK